MFPGRTGSGRIYGASAPCIQKSVPGTVPLSACTLQVTADSKLVCWTELPASKSAPPVLSRSTIISASVAPHVSLCQATYTSPLWATATCDGQTNPSPPLGSDTLEGSDQVPPLSSDRENMTGSSSAAPSPSRLQTT